MPSAHSSQIDVARLYPSNAIQTPFTGSSPDQSRLLSGPQSGQPLKGVYRTDAISSSNTRIDMKKSTVRIILSRLGETPHGTPLQVDISGPINGECPEPKRVGETKQPWFNNKQKWVVGLVVLLMLVLLGSGLSTLMLFLSASHGGETVIGHIRFVKNGSSQNYNALQIDIRQVPEQPQGIAYYAWVELGNEQWLSF